jgi:Tol biopolymer transport system component
MTELRTLVEREMDRAGVPSSTFVDLEHRRVRRHRDRRIIAGVVGVLVGLVAILSGVSVIRSSTNTIPANPPTPTSTRARLSFALDDGKIVSKHPKTGDLDTIAAVAGASAIAWSPDGRQVAIERSRGVGCRVFVLTILSGELRDLAGCYGDPYPRSGLDWSADGRWIAFLVFPDHQIAMMHPDGTDMRSIQVTGGFPLTADGFSLSPDGSRIAFESNRKIYVVESDGSNRAFVTNGSSPDWSPDGSEIALIRDPRGHGPAKHGDPFVAQLWIVRPDGSGLSLLDRWRGCCIGGVLTAPKFSPDGSRIALIAANEIRVVSADGAKDRTIESPPGWVPDDISWRPLPGDGGST